MLWENENLTDVAEYGPSLPCSARSLEHFLITATGVSVEWSNKPLPMYTLGSCCVQVGFGGFHRLCLTWSHFYFLKFVRGNETMHCSNCSQVMQVPEPPIPAGCILAFSYCRTGSEISWHSLVCSWVTFLFPSPFSWQWVLGQCSQISHLLFVNGRNIPTQVCLTEGQISWQLNFWTKIGEHPSLLHSWYVYFFPASVELGQCEIQSAYHKANPITRLLLSSLLEGRVTSDKVKLLQLVHCYPEVMFQMGMWFDLLPCTPFPVAASSSPEPGSRIAGFAPASRKWDGSAMWTQAAVLLSVSCSWSKLSTTVLC